MVDQDKNEEGLNQIVLSYAGKQEDELHESN
jgi:hypothetical protein